MSTAGNRRIVLVGMMGSGKTTVGRVLASRLRCDLLDTDAVVEAREGRTVRDIFAADVEEAFREIESEVLSELLSRPGASVIAAAGGVVLRQQNRDALRASGARVVWLSADPGMLADRVKGGVHRPLLDGDPEGTLRRMYEQREAMYREVADVIVTVDGRSVTDVVDAVLR